MKRIAIAFGLFGFVSVAGPIFSACEDDKPAARVQADDDKSFELKAGKGGVELKVD